MPTRNNIAIIGDSLTQWFDWQRRFPEHTVLNLGISGETVEELLSRRDRIRSQVDAPDYIFLMTGINNIANGQYDFISSYREIVRNFTTWYKQATIVIQSILPADHALVDNDVIRRTNLQLEEIAAEYGAAWLDVYSLFVDTKGNSKAGYLSDDGVHLASKGYEVWAKMVENIIRRK